jgi:hypothetical protein
MDERTANRCACVFAVGPFQSHANGPTQLVMLDCLLVTANKTTAY